MMKISLILAKSKNNVIGRNNQLPWHLPADLKHFKALTMGKPIIMGRKTYESIGKALPGRRNIIISHQKNLKIENGEVFSSIEAALSALKTASEVMIIGGANLYQQFIDRAESIYMTVIDAEFEGDTFFPPLLPQWKLLAEEKFLADDKNRYGYCFQVWERE